MEFKTAAAEKSCAPKANLEAETIEEVCAEGWIDGNLTLSRRRRSGGPVTLDPVPMLCFVFQICSPEVFFSYG